MVHRVRYSFTKGASFRKAAFHSRSGLSLLVGSVVKGKHINRFSVVRDWMFDFTLGTHPISTKGTTEIGGAKRRSDFDCLH